jgi:hypothetical protein
MRLLLTAGSHRLTAFATLIAVGLRLAGTLGLYLHATWGFQVPPVFEHDMLELASHRHWTPLGQYSWSALITSSCACFKQQAHALAHV